MMSRTIDFHNQACNHVVMKADLRISVKDYRPNKNLKILIQSATFSHRQFYVRMNGAPCPWRLEPITVQPRSSVERGKPCPQRQNNS
jgi:hypothetical protein